MQTTPKVRKKILVVEDEGLIADDIRRRLERLGYSVPATASSGEEALELTRAHSFDLVLMDIRLKGEMDGIAVAEQLQRDQRAPVVYLTAHADQDTVSRATATEPFGYILKPIADGNLRSTVQIALYKHELERRLRVSEAWLSTTLRSIGDGIVATDANGEIVFLNAAAERLTGWTAAEAKGRALMEILSLREEPSGEPARNPVFDLLPDEARIYQLASPAGTPCRWRWSVSKIAMTANCSAPSWRSATSATAGSASRFRSRRREWTPSPPSPAAWRAISMASWPASGRR